VVKIFLPGFQSNMWKNVPTQPPTLGDCALTWFKEGVLLSSANSFMPMIMYVFIYSALSHLSLLMLCCKRGSESTACLLLPTTIACSWRWKASCYAMNNLSKLFFSCTILLHFQKLLLSQLIISLDSGTKL